MDDRWIGKDRREATNWAQDFMRTSRPDAEEAVEALFEADLLSVEDDGFYLLEADDDELRRRIRLHSQDRQIKRMQVRRFRRNHKLTKLRKRKLFRHDYSDVADAMIYGSPEGEPK